VDSEPPPGYQAGCLTGQKTEFVVAIQQKKTVFSLVIKVGFRKRKVRDDARDER
jgi:hypothetical protein